jgi:hypothetical protein
MVFVPFLASAEGATIWTDKDNYGPSETVTIFGSGFLPSTEVTITLEAPDLSVATIYAWTDEFGAFTAQYVLDGMEGTYTITATDGTNTATTTFTEAPKVAATWADGDCEDIKVTASGLASGKNYYMTYTDPGSVVQRTTPTFPGPSAYTEYFVLDITLPTILGTWTMKLYETPSTLKDTDTVDIGMMVWTTDSTYATMKTSFAQGETLYIKAIGLLASKYYNFRLDPPTGSSIYVFSSYQGGVTQLTGSYVLPLTAKTGEWKLHVRKADNAAGTSHEGHYVDRYFTVTPYTAPPTYSVTFDAVATSPLPDVDGTTVIVTGTIGVTSFTVTNAELPKTFAGITSGTTITYTYTDPVPSTVLDKRYRLLSVTGPSSGFSLTTDTTITGNYKAQYYLTVSSDHGTTSGEDWYDECTYAYAGLDIGMVEEDGTRYLFVEWTGDASGTGLTSDAIHMDGPKTAIAEWKTQYYLTVVSPYDTPGGMGWYDKDATAYATLVSGIVDLAPGQRAVFTGWTGDASGTGLTSDAITMSGPKTATALWVIQWYLDVDVAPPEAGTVPGEDWYNHCTTVTLTAPEYLPSEAGTSGVRYKFSSWDVDGTPVTGNPIDVHMDAPHIATAHYTVQYYLTVKTDPEGIATIPGEGWYDACTWKTLTAPLEPDVKYLFAYWDVDSFFDVFLENVIKVHMDAPHTATAHYKDYLGHAREEIEDLRAYLNALRAAGKIGKREYDYFMHALNAIEKDITRGMKQLDRERHGFNDRQKGFEDLRHAVMKIKRLIHQVENWVKKGKIPAGDAAWIISELETIRMKLVNKAWAEALAEKVLALKAIAAAKALGKDTTKAEAELIKINRELAKAIQKIAEGKYSQAIQHFKHAFNHSQHAVKKAYDPSWSIDYKDWIDELEEEDP